MHDVFYAGTTLTTGDDIAAAFMEVVIRVAQSGRPELVDVPCRNVGGVHPPSEITMATVVIVPGTAALATKISGAEPELVDPEAVERIRGELQSIRPIPHSPEAFFLDVEASYDFDEWI